MQKFFAFVAPLVASLAAVFVLLALPLRAQVVAGPEIGADVVRLAEALRLEETVALMRDEGLIYGRELEQSMFPGRGGEGWRAAVSRLYDEQAMLDAVMQGFAATLAGADLRPLLGFFESPLGVRVVGLELSARRALIDPDVEQANAEHVDRLLAEDDPRIALLSEFIDANDLIEMNVSGTLNSDFAFYQGLQDGGAYETPRSEVDILRDVAREEDAIREDTRKWLFRFLWLAYSPLSDDELRAYTEISLTPEGQQLNAALFAGFDAMFDDISAGLGRAAARVLTSDDL